MPRPSKGARLYWRPQRGQWVILDTGNVQRGTGTADRGEAEKRLAEYIAAKGGRRGGPAEPADLTVAEVLAHYGEHHAPYVRDPARIGYAIAALIPFWGMRTVSAITRANCRAYIDGRGVAPGTIRKELGTLRTALNFCVAEGVLSRAPVVTMPPKPQPRDRVLTRDEVARLLRAARAHHETRHIARYILLALTGTRMAAILALRFDRHPGGGWIDVNSGVLYRRASDQIETKKRRPPVRLPRRLLSHCRRWAREGGWAIQFRGQKVGSIKTAWRRVCAEAGVEGVTRHTFKHTAITWAMEAGVPLADAAGYFGTSIGTLEREYFHLHPDFQIRTAAAMDRAGRR